MYLTSLFDFLFKLISNLSSVNTPIYASLFTLMNTNENLEVILLQATWLHQDIDDCVDNIDGFSTLSVDRNINFRNRGGGVLTYVNQTWCKLKFLSRFISLVITNLYISPKCSPTSFIAFTDEFTSFIVPFIGTSFCMIADDFNRCDTAFLSLLNLSNIVNFPTRNSAFLDKIFVNSL